MIWSGHSGNTLLGCEMATTFLDRSGAAVSSRIPLSTRRPRVHLRPKTKEEGLLMKAMELLGQWPSRHPDCDATYAKTLRGQAEKMSRYVPSNAAPCLLLPALQLLARWPPPGADLLSEEQLSLRVEVVDLYDQWTDERRLLVVTYS